MDSVQEQIVKKIVAKLALITTANGYSNTIASVQRHNLDGVETVNVPTLLVKEGECTAELGRSVAPSVMRRQEMFVVIITTQDPLDARSGGEILNSLIADVERCLSQHRTWDGLAITTDPPDYFETELDATMPHLTKGLRCSVQYEHFRNDPYGQA